jgi:hypothetical protein
MKLFEGKSIILGAPKHFGLADLIEKELANLGFTVINISFLDNHFKYKDIFQRLKSFIIKNLGGNKFYKHEIQFRRIEDTLIQKLAEIEQADYTFIIRPDVYPLDFLKTAIAKGHKSVGYQWDGLDRFPKVHLCIPLFDRFFVFDPTDKVKYPNLLLTTNFYPHTIQPDPQLPKTDFYYSGSYNKNRIKVLENLASTIKSLALNFFYILLYKKKNKRPDTFLNVRHTGVSFVQNIQYVMRTDVLIDLVNPVHEGLSFRVFEAIGFRKKLVTNHQDITGYDFYHPNNILVWHSQSNTHDLQRFLDLPYQNLPDEIYEKYGFAKWIERMLT